MSDGFRDHVDENGETNVPQKVLDRARAEVEEEHARIKRWKKTKKSKRDWAATKR